MRRTGNGGGPSHNGSRDDFQPGLPVPAAGERGVVLHGHVVDGHHQRARAAQRREKRIRRVYHRRSGPPDQRRQLAAAMHRANADSGLNEIRVSGQAVQREQLRSASTYQRRHPGAVAVRRRCLGRELDDRPGQAVRPWHGVHPCVDQQQWWHGWHVTPIPRQVT